MKRRVNFRPSLAEQRRQSQAAHDYWGAMTGKEPIDVGAKPKRERREPPKTFRLTAERPLERDVLSAVRDHLRVHPLVAWVARINNGAATDQAGNFVRFNTIAGCSDLIGQLKSGEFLACEIKRPGETPTEPQMLFLRMVRQWGGCAGWADSIEAAERMIREWAERSR